MQIGRVSVNADSSYVSIDLSDLARLGYILKSIEIVDDSRLPFSTLIGRHGVFRGLSLLLPRTDHRVESRLPREWRYLLGSLHHNRE